MEAVSDVATNPNNTRIVQSGNGGYFTKAGNPARFVIINDFEGIKIKVVIEPAGEGIITAHPIK
jgi:hypothetical protein